MHETELKLEKLLDRCVDNDASFRPPKSIFCLVTLTFNLQRIRDFFVDALYKSTFTYF